LGYFRPLPGPLFHGRDVAFQVPSAGRILQHPTSSSSVTPACPLLPPAAGPSNRSIRVCTCCGTEILHQADLPTPTKCGELAPFRFKNLRPPQSPILRARWARLYHQPFDGPGVPSAPAAPHTGQSIDPGVAGPRTNPNSSNQTPRYATSDARTGPVSSLPGGRDPTPLVTFPEPSSGIFFPPTSRIAQAPPSLSCPAGRFQHFSDRCRAWSPHLLHVRPKTPFGLLGSASGGFFCPSWIPLLDGCFSPVENVAGGHRPPRWATPLWGGPCWAFKASRHLRRPDRFFRCTDEDATGGPGSA